MHCQRDLFQLPEGPAYLNCAYMSPQLRSVEAVGHDMLSRKNQPFLLHPQDFFSTVERLKASFARLTGVEDHRRIALVPSVSYGVATVAQNLPLGAGQEILVAGEQFPSNYYSWKRLAEERGAVLRAVPAPASAFRTASWNEALLEAIGERTALVALPPVHWADGTRFDLVSIRQKTRQYGAWLVLDGTQSVGALPFDVAEIQPEALICAGYKWLLGPYGLGLAYYGPAMDGGRPLEENWINRKNSEDFRQLVHYQDEYQPLAGRYSVGEQSNFILAPMLNRAMEQILEWSVPAIQQYTLELSRGPVEQLREMGAGVEHETQRCGHLFGVRLEGRFDAEMLGRQFQEKQVYVSLRGDAIRIAPHVYNQPEDFSRLLHCFEAARLSLPVY